MTKSLRPQRRGTPPPPPAPTTPTTATLLHSPALPGAVWTWTDVTLGSSTEEEYAEYRLTVNLEQQNPAQIVQLCEGAGLPIKFIEYLRTSEEKTIVVTFLPKPFLAAQNGRSDAAAAELVTAEIGEPSTEWVAWLLICGSYALLEKQAAALTLTLTLTLSLTLTLTLTLLTLTLTLTLSLALTLTLTLLTLTLTRRRERGSAASTLFRPVVWAA